MGIHIKNADEIQAMREGGKILAAILKDLELYVQPGITTLDIEKKAEQLFKGYMVKPGFKGFHGYPAILCISVNDEIVHGIPNDRVLENGDILSIDCGVKYKNLNTDSAVAIIVGEDTSPKAKKLVNTCKKALWCGIKEVKAGNKVGDIGAAIEKYVKGSGFSIVPSLTGHGIGYQLHEEPHVPNYGKKGKGNALIPGMVIAIEPIIVAGSPKYNTLDDGWTIVTRDGDLSIQHEHSVLVTETGYEVLTLREGEKVL